MTRKSKTAIGSIAGLALVVSLFAGSTQAAEAAPLSTHHVASGIGASQQTNQRKLLALIVKAAQSYIAGVKKANPGIYSKIRILGVYPGTVVYEYTYAKHLDPSAASAYFDSKLSTLKTTAKATVFPSLRLGGLTGTLHLEYVFKNPNGSTIWKKVLTSTK